jgi:NTP pyrophosphatase (non-canonical NTP hydrolase)
MNDATTTLKEIKERAHKFNLERDWDQFHNAKDLAISISLEASELLEPFIYKNNVEVEGLMDSAKRESIEDELADVLWGVVMFADKYNIDLSEVFERKMEKTAKKYPIEKAKGSNKKYTEL